MSPYVNFRVFERSDMGPVIALLKAISPYQPPEEIYDEIFLEFIGQQNVFSVVAELDGIVVGYGVMIMERKIRGGKLGHIEDIVTHPNHRGKGIGRALIDVLSTRAFGLGCYKVALHCSEENTGFYERCGFVTSGTALQRFGSQP